LFGALGAVALTFAVIAFLLHFLTAARLFSGWDFVFAVANGALGIGCLLVSLLANVEATRARYRTEGARRARRHGTNALLQTAIGIGILVMLAVLSTRYHARWDWTEASLHSLSGQSVKVLEGLEAEGKTVRVVAIFQNAVAGEARDFLERYASVAAEGFEIEFIDPNQQPARLAELGVASAAIGEGLLHVVIGNESVDVETLSEEALTNALVSLTRLERKKVYFLDGHNEHPIQDQGADEVDGFAQAAEALRNENYEVESLSIFTAGEVPADADVLIAAGPTRPYRDEEHVELQAYLDRGGSLLVLLDPGAKTDLYPDLARWGVEVGDDIVFDQRQALAGRPMSPVAAEYADHPITRELQQVTLFHLARSVQVTADSTLSPLVKTSIYSWAERDLETQDAVPDPDVDIVGGVIVMVAGDLPGEGSGRLAVVGDADFATNQLLREFSNRDLFVNTVNWLLGDVEAISIRPPLTRASRLRLSQDQFETIRVLSLFVAPEVIALLGVAVWNRRRSQGR
jgi:ABC-type uncharacterized transport system involved in gliding motility auxiliary subunit